MSTLLSELSQFTGTEHYYRLPHPRLSIVLTDGTRHLLEHCDCGAMLYHFTQHFLDALEGKKDRFITLTYQTVLTKGVVQIHDGDGHTYAYHSVPRIPALEPGETLSLYAIWDTSNWVVMVPSEY